MHQEVQKRIIERNMMQGGDKVLAAVSGGADSVCLLLILEALRGQLGYMLEVVHVEHGIRGEESRQDEVFVEELCHRLEVPVYTVSVDVPSYAAEQGIGLEEAARILRYEVFEELALARGAKVALAHHMEDNAETVLFQMMRGSGLHGLCGMQPIRQSESGVVYIRPLLDVHRAEIEDFLKSRGEAWREDRTNQETEYSRNYVRQVILPQLLRLNDRAVEHINQSAEQLSELRDYMEQGKRQVKDQVVLEDGVSLRISKLLELHPALQKELILDAVAQTAGSRKDITAGHVKSVLDLCEKQSGREVHLPYGIVARRDFDCLVLAIEDAKTERLKRTCRTLVEERGVTGDSCLVVNEEQLVELAQADGTEVLEVPLGTSDETLQIKVFSYHGENLKFLENPYTKWMDYDKIRHGFCIRTRQSGDYFIGDSQGHHKKLKQYFTEEKISVSERNARWLLAQDSLVLWLVGGRISEHLKVTDETKLVVEITYQGGTEDGF